MTRTTTVLITIALLGLTLAVSGAAQADIIWGNAVWQVYTVGGAPYTDPLGDIAPATSDLVGDAARPSLYWCLDSLGTPAEADDTIMFRMRVDELPGLNTGTFQIFFNTDADANADWVLQQDRGNDADVEFQQALPGGPTWGDVNVPIAGNPDNNPYEWTGTLTGWSRSLTVASEVPGYTAFSGANDYFIDFGMPWASFSTYTGIANQSVPFSFAATSSTQHNNINKDLPQLQGFGDPVTFGDDTVVPEPGTWALLGLGLVGLGWWRRRR